MIITESLVTICHHTKMLHNPHAVHFIPVTHLSCNWKFVSSPSPSPISFFPSCPSPLATTYLFSVFMTVSILLCSFICFFDSTYKWNPHISEIWLISLTIILSRSIWVVPNDKIAFIFEWLSNIQLCTYMPCILCPFIYWRTLRLLLNLGYYN